MSRMSSNSSSHRDNDRNENEAPMSRLFVICNKDNSEADIRESFKVYGSIVDVWMVKDKRSGENKGVVYIKFSKTSEAAKALEEMNGKIINESERPIKVLVANSRNQGSKKYTENEEEKYLRLFVLIPKDMNETELTDEFTSYGEIDNVTIIRDKVSKEGKGFGYVKFTKFSDAAVAFENADPKYKAVFAEPKPSQKSNSDRDNFSSGSGGNNNRGNNYFGNSSFGGNSGFGGQNSSFGSGGGGGGGGFNDFGSNSRRQDMGRSNSSSSDGTLYVICSPSVNQDQLWRLFDIIPGLDFCQINGECGRNGLYAKVVYNSGSSASYAREKIHGLEYPPGERLIVKNEFDFKGNLNSDSVFPFMNKGLGGGGGIGGGSRGNSGGGNGNTNFNNDLDDSFCSVKLPPVCPVVDENTPVAQRCFLVCVSQAIPVNILQNVFSRFGNLIDVYLLPNKNCGYAKFADENSCQRAIETLHGAEIYGVRIKVMEAEELGNSDDRRKRQRRDE